MMPNGMQKYKIFAKSAKPFYNTLFKFAGKIRFKYTNAILFDTNSQFIVILFGRFNSFSYLCSEFTTYCDYGHERDRNYH